METQLDACACAEAACGADPQMGHMALAMAYVPWQRWEQLYAPEKALCRGTLFPSLDLPFCGSEVFY